jgi:hypothetical protein
MRSMTTNFSLLVLLMPNLAWGFQLASSVAPGRRAHPTRATTVLVGPEDERSPETKAEDDALAEAFNKRLEQEGGATQFKIRSSLTGAADEIKAAAAGIKGNVPELPTVKANDFLNADGKTILGGLFFTVLIFTVINSGLNSSPSDMSTSDGTTLEFGKRSELRDVRVNRDPYSPQYGTQ